MRLSDASAIASAFSPASVMKAFNGRAFSMAVTKRGQFAGGNLLGPDSVARLGQSHGGEIAHYSTTSAPRRNDPRYRRIDHQGVGLTGRPLFCLPAISVSAHTLVMAGTLRHRPRPASRPLEDAVQFAGHGFQSCLWHGQPGQFGDAAHGVLIDGHEFLLC